MNADMTLGKSRAGYTARRDRGLLDGAVIREGLRRVAEQPVRIGVAHIEERIDPAALLRADGHKAHRAVDVGAVARMGGHAPRGRQGH